MLIFYYFVPFYVVLFLSIFSVFIELFWFWICYVLDKEHRTIMPSLLDDTPLCVVALLGSLVWPVVVFYFVFVVGLRWLIRKCKGGSDVISSE
jgi:hypothetical protein